MPTPAITKEALLETVAALEMHKRPYLAWDAKLRLVSPSGEAKVWARHDFKGDYVVYKPKALRNFLLVIA